MQQKNQRVRKAMFMACLNQRELSKILEKSEQEVSIVLNGYELAKSEQDEIVRKIKEYAAS